MRWITSLLALTLFGTMAMAADEELSPGQWKEKEHFGLGLGLLTNGFGAGAHVFGDYNLSGKIQIHVDLSGQTRQRFDLVGDNIETTTGALTGALRYFPDDARGWFLGGGSGFGSVRQHYSGSVGVTSTTSFIPIFFDGGWQGWDGYYFTVNLQLGFSVETSMDDRTGSIPNIYNHQGTAKDDFRDARAVGANGIFIGFGWYFPAPVNRVEVK